MADHASTEITRHGVTRRWSDAVVHGGVAYFVEVAADPTAAPARQFAQVFEQAEATLARVGSGLNRLLQVTIVIPFPEDLAEFNRQWDAWIPEGHAPSRACLHTQLVNPHYRVELIITAAVE
ncbi:MAG: hypothetical protein C0478_03895 [Planctomyces sp.]|nr:hypothetical protein [Planctomyces sp.]